MKIFIGNAPPETVPYIIAAFCVGLVLLAFVTGAALRNYLSAAEPGDGLDRVDAEALAEAVAEQRRKEMAEIDAMLKRTASQTTERDADALDQRRIDALSKKIKENIEATFTMPKDLGAEAARQLKEAMERFDKRLTLQATGPASQVDWNDFVKHEQAAIRDKVAGVTAEFVRPVVPSLDNINYPESDLAKYPLAALFNELRLRNWVPSLSTIMQASAEDLVSAITKRELIPDVLVEASNAQLRAEFANRNQEPGGVPIAVPVAPTPVPFVTRENAVEQAARIFGNIDLEVFDHETVVHRFCEIIALGGGKVLVVGEDSDVGHGVQFSIGGVDYQAIVVPNLIGVSRYDGGGIEPIGDWKRGQSPVIVLCEAKWSSQVLIDALGRSVPESAADSLIETMTFFLGPCDGNVWRFHGDVDAHGDELTIFTYRNRTHIAAGPVAMLEKIEGNASISEWVDMAGLFGHHGGDPNWVERAYHLGTDETLRIKRYIEDGFVVGALCEIGSKRSQLWPPHCVGLNGNTVLITGYGGSIADRFVRLAHRIEEATAFCCPNIADLGGGIKEAIFGDGSRVLAVNERLTAVKRSDTSLAGTARPVRPS